MYSRGKYIVGELKEGAITALCFNEVATHGSFQDLFHEIHGAGFFWVTETGEVVAHDKSVSLGVESRGEADAFQIRRVLGMEPTY